MGNNDDWGNNRGRGGGKPQAPAGISSVEAEALRAQVSALSFRLEKVEKFLREHFDEKNQWNSLVRDWVGKKVVVELIQIGREIQGELLWLDRYTICVEDMGRSKVIHKAAIALIYLAG